MEYVEKTIQKRYVYKGKIMKVRRDDVLLPDGKTGKRELIEHNGGSSVLYIEDGKVLFVRQFRYAYGESLYEIPAGKLEEGEDPESAAARELEEETGIKAERLELLCTLYPTPGYTNEKIYIYRAYGGEKVSAYPDVGEFLDVVYIPLERVREMLKNGEFKDGKTMIALQGYFLSEK